MYFLLLNCQTASVKHRMGYWEMELPGEGGDSVWSWGSDPQTALSSLKPTLLSPALTAFSSWHKTP